MSQAQCPNCGGYKVSSKKFVVLSTGKRRKYYPVRGKTAFWIMLAWYIAMMLYAVIMSEGQEITLAMLLFVIVGVPTFAYFYFYAKKEDGSVLAFDHICNLCGYKWTRYAGQPAPDVTVRPDLIVQGALKLEEEEKRRRDASIAFQAREYQKRKNK